MKLKLVSIFLFLFFFGMSFVSSSSQTISIFYEGINSSYDSNSQFSQGIPFQDILLKITTSFEEVCKYSETKGTPYDVMTNLFDETGAIIHKKTFLDLNDGSHKYYVKCSNGTFYNNTLHEPGELEVILRVNSLVTGQVLVSSESPLKAGMYEITLVTSKVISQTPQLEYSYNDGIDSYPLVLMGSGKNWKGYLTISKSNGEGKLSFTMKAVDLEGRTGTEIKSGKFYLYDTIKPSPVTIFEAKSLEGSIDLNWEYEDGDFEFKIYRSESPNPGYSDYYKTVLSQNYEDSVVESGKTYFYRIIPVDSAGNLGDFSKEVSGVSLSSNYNYLSSGLSPVLIGKVESFLNEISEVKDEAVISQSFFNSQDGMKRDFVLFLGFDKKIKKIVSDLGSLESSVEKYKSQDLSEEELIKKISSSRVKLEILGKEIPEDFVITDQESFQQEVSSEDIEKAILLINPTISESSKEKSLKESLELVDSSSFSVNTDVYSVTINYFSGSRKEYLFVKRKINSNLERKENVYVVEQFPLELISSGAQIDFGDADFKKLNDFSYSFDSDVKSILYSVSKGDFKDLKEIKLSLISIYNEKESSSSITGFFLFESFGGEGSFIYLIVFLVLIGVIYLFYFRKGDFSDDYFRILNRINEANDFLNKEDLESSKKSYLKVKSSYLKLEEKERKKIYPQVEKLYNDLLIFEFEKGLNELKKNKNLALFKKLEKIYETLPSLFKQKISSSFFDLKKSFGEENEV